MLLISSIAWVRRLSVVRLGALMSSALGRSRVRLLVQCRIPILTVLMLVSLRCVVSCVVTVCVSGVFWCSTLMSSGCLMLVSSVV